MGTRAGSVNYARLRAALEAWARHCPRVVLIDELDGAGLMVVLVAFGTGVDGAGRWRFLIAC
jgi:hypothetical protein